MVCTSFLFFVYRIKAGSVIGLSCNLVCLIAIMLQPYMPQTVNIIGKQLNVDISIFLLNDFVSIFLQPGHKIGKVKINKFYLKQ